MTTALRRTVPWLLLTAAVALVAWIRADWIEPAAVAHRCLAGAATLGCHARAWAVLAFTSGGVTVAALASAVLALVWRHPLPATLAVLCGGVAMVLYRAEPGAAALLIGVLRLARAQADAGAKPARQHG